MTKLRSKPSKKTTANVNASFRDPAGFIYKDSKGVLLRQINKEGAEDFDLLMSSGLYEALVKEKMLVEHKKMALSKAKTAGAHAVIQPETVPFVSYPFEWSFSQIKDAALLTLAIQKKAMAHGMTLKDASAYNIQFHEGRPVFIDTLSFEKLEPGQPWQAYRQFCQHFLAPLSLMSYADVALSQLSRIYIDGIPLDLAAKLLPRRARFRPGLMIHIFMHARAQKAKQSTAQRPQAHLSQQAVTAIIDSLERNVAKLQPKKKDTEWGDYYHNTNYTASAADQKAKLIKKFVSPLKAKTALDLGGNNGRYSRVLNKMGIATVCSDIDPNAVENNYRYAKHHKETMMLPLVVDLTNPGGALGWHNDEREPIHQRINTDVVMALAIVHHLAISNNLPLEQIAKYFVEFAPHLVIEFVPKEDSQVKILLATRKDIFPNYTEEGLEQAFAKHYKLEKKEAIKDTKRTLYLFKRK
jgi:ribosomal protein L11 methylase PrmA